MRIIKIFVLQFLVSFILCFACSSEEKDLAKTGFYSSSDKIIEKLDNEKAGYREHFLLGVSWKKKGDMKKAIFHFANSCFRYSSRSNLKLYPYPVYDYITGLHIKSELYDDSVYEIARLFYDYREYEYVIKFVDLLEKAGSGLYRDAVLLKSNALAALGRYSGALSCLRELSGLYSDINSRSLIYIRIASVYERMDSFKEAVEEYFKVIRLDKTSWQAGIACSRILKISADHQYDFNTEQEIDLAFSLYYNSTEESLKTLKGLIGNRLKEPSGLKILQYAVKAYVKTGRIKEADELILKRRGDTSEYYRLMKIKADTLWSVKKRKSAYEVYTSLLKHAVDIDIKRVSHKRIAQFLISTEKKYEDILTDYIRDYPYDESSGYFLWVLARDSLKKDDYNAAAKYMENSLSVFPDGPFSGRNRFWLAKLYFLKGRDNDAIQKHKEMAAFNPDSAYTWKMLEQVKDSYKTNDLKDWYEDSVRSEKEQNALFYHALLMMHQKDFKERDKRLNELDFADNIKKYRSFNETLKKRISDSEETDNLKNIEKYFRIGYNEGVNREAGLIPDKKDLQAEKYRVLANFGRVYNNYFYSSVSLLNLFNYYNIRENVMLLPVEVIKNLFPVVFEEYVEKLCRERDISKEMVYSVIKAESSFNHRAVSPAGASGLMQLMPATARGIAKESGIKDFDLTDPLISITFGVKYLSWLNKLFDGNFVYITAGYNGGPANVKRWRNDIDNPDEDFFVEFIPYQETRHYVLRTQRFFIQYKLLNDALYSD